MVVEGADTGNLPTRGACKPLLPVPLWGEVRPDLRRTADEAHEDDEPGLERARPLGLNRRGGRRERGGARRARGLTLINKGELLLLATDMANVARPDDEEDPDAARRAPGTWTSWRWAAATAEARAASSSSSTSTRRRSTLCRSGRSSPTPSGTTSAGPTSRTIAR